MDFFENEIPQEEFQNQAKFHSYDRKYVKPVDPYNPFDNPTENPEYNRDYGEVVPQIAIPGCELPFIPGKEEKKKIRNSYNIAVGGNCLIGCNRKYFICHCNDDNNRHKRNKHK